MKSERVIKNMPDQEILEEFISGMVKGKSSGVIFDTERGEFRRIHPGKLISKPTKKK